MGRVATPPYERLMLKVERRGECLEFTGKRNWAGYGRTSVQVDGRTRELMAHRVVYEHHHGPLAPELQVRHRCDNPPCVEIAHLLPGTALDNSQDMVERARGRKGAQQELCANGHDLAVHGIRRPTRSQNPDHPEPTRCGECQRIAVRVSRERRTGKAYTGQPHHSDKTHCIRGHEFTEENTYVKKDGGRQCRRCVSDANKARYQERKKVSA
jgi:hypothetical protein